MAAKQIVYNQDARERIRAGVRQLARAVKVTLGPRGRNVVIQKSFGSPTVTKDGVTVAKEIELKDPYENMGAQMVKEVASKTSDVAGDGTTTATILAEEGRTGPPPWGRHVLQSVGILCPRAPGSRSDGGTAQDDPAPGATSGVHRPTDEIQGAGAGRLGRRSDAVRPQHGTGPSSH